MTEVGQINPTWQILIWFVLEKNKQTLLLDHLTFTRRGMIGFYKWRRLYIYFLKTNGADYESENSSTLQCFVNCSEQGLDRGKCDSESYFEHSEPEPIVFLRPILTEHCVVCRWQNQSTRVDVIFPTSFYF